MKLRNSENKKLIRAVNRFQPWDYAFLLDLEKESLDIMCKYYSESLYYNEPVRYLKLASKLLDIVLEKDTSVRISTPECVSIKYVNTRNWNRFFPKDSNKESAVIKDAFRVQKAWHLYNLIRYRELLKWWE